MTEPRDREEDFDALKTIVARAKSVRHDDQELGLAVLAAYNLGRGESVSECLDFSQPKKPSHLKSVPKG